MSVFSPLIRRRVYTCFLAILWEEAEVAEQPGSCFSQAYRIFFHKCHMLSYILKPLMSFYLTYYGNDTITCKYCYVTSNSTNTKWKRFDKHLQECWYTASKCLLKQIQEHLWLARRDTNLLQKTTWECHDLISIIKAYTSILQTHVSAVFFLPNTCFFTRNVKCQPLPLRLRRSTMPEDMQYYYTLYSSNSNQPQETEKNPHIVTVWKTEREIFQRASPKLTHCM